MRPLIVTGSARQRSRTRAAAALASVALSSRGMQPTLVDLAESSLPLATGEYHGRAEVHPSAAVRDWAAKVRACDAVVVATPVYHGSIPAILKNAFDHIGIGETEYKPGAVIVFGSAYAAGAASEHVRSVMRALRMVVVPTQVFVTGEDLAASSAGLQDSPLWARLQLQSSELSLYHSPSDQVRPA